MSDEDDRRRAREGEHDPAARASAELAAARRAPPEDPPEGDPDNPVRRSAGGLVPIPVPPSYGARPRKNPMWVRTTLRAGAWQVDLADQPNTSLSHGLACGLVPVGTTMFVYGMSVLPTVTSDNADDVRRVWEYAEVHINLGAGQNLLRLPAKLVMPNPVLLPFAGAELYAVRLALVTDKALATKWLRQSIFGGEMIRDLQVMQRPIQFEAGTLLRVPLFLTCGEEPVEHDVDFLLVFFGIMLHGISS